MPDCLATVPQALLGDSNGLRIGKLRTLNDPLLNDECVKGGPSGLRREAPCKGPITKGVQVADLARTPTPLLSRTHARLRAPLSLGRAAGMRSLKLTCACPFRIFDGKEQAIPVGL